MWHKVGNPSGPAPGTIGSNTKTEDMLEGLVDLTGDSLEEDVQVIE